MQPMTPTILEQIVLSKPYFDRHGLIVAEEEGRPIGFVHAGFGASDDHTCLSTELGVICILQVVPRDDSGEIAAELIQQAEAYLKGQGAQLIYAGGIRPLDPFYLGLYGGSELPGILASDTTSLDFFQANGYEEIDRRMVFQLDLTSFRPKVDRQQMQIRRGYNVDAVFDPRASSWWEACTCGHVDRTHFSITGRADRKQRGRAIFWDMEPICSSWGVHAVGLSTVEINEDARRQGLATHLIGEAIRQLTEQGATLCEAQTMAGNATAISLYKKLGFQEVDQGIVLRKQG